jgi:hypothetical protein
VRDADGDAAAIGPQVVNAVRNGDADRVGAEVVIVDPTRGEVPSRARVLEGADQLPLLGVDADDGQVTALEVMAQVADVQKLLVAIGTGIGGELLVVDPERIAHLAEQTPDRVRTDGDAKVAERQGHFGRGAAGPFHTGDGIPGGVVLQQELDQGDEVGRFFSAGGRPPPPRRTRPGATS